MRRDASVLLFDVKRSAEAILRITSGLRREDYGDDDLIRPAVERHFEVLGEALGRLRKVDPQLAGRIRDLNRAIAFRNVLIHGYDTVDDETVWNTIAENLPVLLSDIEVLIAERRSL